jgi:CheY-like chemotaxis protein
MNYSNWSSRGDNRADNILIVEDDIELRSSIRDFLISHGYIVRTARDGAEGIRQILTMDFDAIICDMIMPAFPGDKFYLATSRVKPHLCERFIFITGDNGPSHVREFIRSVNGNVLFKPFRLVDLGWAVQDILDKRSVGRIPDADWRPERERVEAREGSAGYFFGTICSIDGAARRFVLYQGTHDRVRTLECAYPNALRNKVMENLNMWVCVLGSLEGFFIERRQIVNVKSLRMISSFRGDSVTSGSGLAILPVA